MSTFRRMAKRLALAAVFSGLGAAFVLEAVPKINEVRRIKAHMRRPKPSAAEMERFSKPLPTRAENLARMSSGQIFDVLVIGGGATGAGVAVDAASRGLSTCLIEKFDFASGTSSRSTKLIHGGVRYLQKAIFNLDLEQFRMVNEALSERANLIDIAPHLAYPLPIMLPVYKFWQLPYFWAGIKMYDLISGKQILKASYYLNKPQVLERFPLLKADKLVGGLVYYDGQHEDARMCLSLALTATRYDAAIANYVEAIELIKGKPYPPALSLSPTTAKAISKSPTQTKAADIADVVTGARVKDRLTGKEFVIRARCVINATGPYTDTVRQMDDKTKPKICQPSAGVHIILPGYYSPSQMGLLDPSTRDGRVIFFLPWMNFSLAGTTDSPCALTDHPAPTEAEVNFILEEIRAYLSPDIKVRRGDVLSAWAGIRPLIRDLNSENTQSIARNHVIEVSPNRLITIAGGKWTTYRSMAEETMDKAIEEHGMDVDVARHLTGVYGDKALVIANMASLTGTRWPILGKKLHPEFPFIEAEVKWACQEYACHAIDFLARRTRLAFLNAVAAQEALPRIVELMAAELGWSKARQKEELETAMTFLGREMGFDLHAQESVPISLTMEETTQLVEKFRKLDSGSKGYISLSDLQRFCEESGEHLSKESLQRALNSMDMDKDGRIDISEYLHFMSALKSGTVAHSPLKRAFSRAPIPVHRSGGGV
ncbi:glycerol-3-phosphate dehydrogenase [Paragonimus westermani]|uniref:Glycerol-3-phosphate dehydrogenase n=1 Tax=Paragonimus westermani TaxID=34504 RepID=A0A5J4NZD8_9TREM|nr:glycerol-3-phosphate dehydrogenase [Paragonimus westermani]